MREFGQVPSSLWLREDLSFHAKALYAYLLSSPHSNYLGYFLCKEGYVCADTGMGRAAQRRGFEQLETAGLARRCGAWVYLPGDVRGNIPRNESVCVARVSAWRELPDCEQKREIAREMLVYYAKLSPAQVSQLRGFLSAGGAAAASPADIDNHALTDKATDSGINEFTNVDTSADISDDISAGESREKIITIPPTPLSSPPAAGERGGEGLIDSILRVTGHNPAKATAPLLRAARRAVGVILTVEPQLSEAQLAHASEVYRRRFRPEGITPAALARHYSALCVPEPASGSGRVSEPDVYAPPPEGWRECLARLYEVDSEALAEREWESVSTSIRQEVLRELARGGGRQGGEGWCERRCAVVASRRALGGGFELPHSEAAEQHVLACVLIDGSDTLSACLARGLPEAAFYSPQYRTIYARMCAIYQSQSRVDISILAEELAKHGELEGVGGYAGLSELGSAIPTTAQVGYFIERVAELHLLRELVRVADASRRACLDHAEGSVAELVDQIEHDLFEVSQQRIRGAAPLRFAAHVEESMAVFAQMQERKFSVTGVRSGFRDLDSLTYGFQPGEMVVLAARPSMGKTALALNFAEAAALPPARPEISAVPVLVFSLEMSAQQLAQRMLCSRARVDMHRLREGFIARQGPQQVALQSAAEELKAAPLFIDDSSQLSVMELRAKARRLHAQSPLGLIIVDYLQLMSPSDSRAPREQQVAECSRGLKALAKELHVPVIVLSQLNRAAERDGRPARLSDLRESGAIEQDADLVLLLGRPSAPLNSAGGVGADLPAELTIAKHRNGPVGELRLTFLKELTRFENYHA